MLLPFELRSAALIRYLCATICHGTGMLAPTVLMEYTL